MHGGCCGGLTGSEENNLENQGLYPPHPPPYVAPPSPPQLYEVPNELDLAQPFLQEPFPLWTDPGQEEGDDRSWISGASTDRGPDLPRVARGGQSQCSETSSSTAGGRAAKKRTLSNPQTSRWLTCQLCRESKTKCDGAFPCSRCWNRMCVCCRPQQHTLESVASRPGPGAKKRRRRRALPEEVTDLLEEEQQDEAMGVVGSTPYVHLVFLRSRPQPLVEVFLRTFGEMYLEEQRGGARAGGGEGGTVEGSSRGKVVRLLRCWQERSAYVGTDVTHGILPALTGLFQVTGKELGEGGDKEGGTEGGAGVDPQSTDSMLVAAERLRGSWASAWVGGREGGREEGGEGGAQDGGVLLAVSDGTLLHWVSNAAFDRLFLSVAGLLNESMARRRLPILLFAALLHPQDRPVWFRGVIRALFTSPGPAPCATGVVGEWEGDGVAGREGGVAPAPRPPTPPPSFPPPLPPPSHVIKAIDREGRISPYRLTVTALNRRVRSPPGSSASAKEGEDGGKEGAVEEHGMVIALVPVPETKEGGQGGTAPSNAPVGESEGGGGGRGRERRRAESKRRGQGGGAEALAHQSAASRRGSGRLSSACASCPPSTTSSSPSLPPWPGNTLVTPPSPSHSLAGLFPPFAASSSSSSSAASSSSSSSAAEPAAHPLLQYLHKGGEGKPVDGRASQSIHSIAYPPVHPPEGLAWRAGREGGRAGGGKTVRKEKTEEEPVGGCCQRIHPPERVWAPPSYSNAVPPVPPLLPPPMLPAFSSLPVPSVWPPPYLPSLPPPGASLEVAGPLSTISHPAEAINRAGPDSGERDGSKEGREEGMGNGGEDFMRDEGLRADHEI
ncbi:hypothetical protein NSK_000843 [Nannochloropsis salina CCMP1776]|uniref:Zn(2)-C6 fungal-type domain-containing protein n=1 Tax=Nannochloropsis salina CCMP1776 TaxID=1027361 RepID=A0A4D9D6Z6_9STRA|nr:hypothetical protein NSK_000843 [Nannochloropsis salina CCMP1776]|eukprot:TFJ87491.1 hypothetical protein NSK_000843 [Nannochloropsis salina CCMP1776]